MGRPVRGFIFSTNGAVPFVGAALSRLVQIFAKKSGWKIFPQKHTGRIGCSTTLARLRLDPRDIDIHLARKSDFMQKYYIKDFLLTDLESPAAKLAWACKSGNLNNFQTHMRDPREKTEHSVFF